MANRNSEIVVQQQTRVVPSLDIRQSIYVYHNEQVIFDVDLARLYGVEVRVLKQAVRRNIHRFPADFMFVVPMREANELVPQAESQIVIPVSNRFGGADPFAFTEQGVAMLSSVLRSATAIQVNIEIVRAFVALRRMVSESHSRELHEVKMDELRARIEKLEELMEVTREDNKEVHEEVSQIYQAINALSAANQSPRPEIGYDAPQYQK